MTYFREVSLSRSISPVARTLLPSVGSFWLLGSRAAAYLDEVQRTSSGDAFLSYTAHRVHHTIYFSSPDRP